MAVPAASARGKAAATTRPAPVQQTTGCAHATLGSTAAATVKRSSGPGHAPASATRAPGRVRATRDSAQRRLPAESTPRLQLVGVSRHNTPHGDKRPRNTAGHESCEPHGHRGALKHHAGLRHRLGRGLDHDVLAQAQNDAWVVGPQDLYQRHQLSDRHARSRDQDHGLFPGEPFLDALEDRSHLRE